ncbi:MAG: MOSC N-terminal beta barrel domain-containing protein [Nitrospiria bacterium]
MHVAELWRYPVKSLAGEPIQVADLSTEGISGDRLVHVQDQRGGIVTSRTRPKLLGLHATLNDGGHALIDGHPWTASASLDAVRAAAGDGTRLVRYEGLERFDVLPLLIATDGAIARLGVDRRRLRPNIVVGGVEGLAEREWPGHRLQIGQTAIVAIAQLRGRCIMTTFDPDTQEQDLSVLRRIRNEFGGTMALDCHVIQGGHVSLGDSVTLLV